DLPRSPSLKSPSNCEFEIVRLFVDAERQAGRGTEEQAMNAVRINSEDQTERRVDYRHHNLKFNACAGPNTGVGSGQEFHLFRCELSVTIEDLPRELALSHHPRVPHIEERSHGEHASDDRNAVFQVENSLRVAADINDIIERPVHGSSCF